MREQLNEALKKTWQEWEIPREADEKWPEAAKELQPQWWEARIARQKEIDASIAAKAESEYLYDKPYEDKEKVRVAGPFTVESLSPHRVLGVDENDESDRLKLRARPRRGYGGTPDFAQMILENLKTAGVQQAHKEDRITFTSLTPLARRIHLRRRPLPRGQGRERAEKRAAIFIGPEFGTVSRPDLVAAAREAGDAGFDVLIACAFNYDAHSAEFEKLGRIPVLKARMNPDLHMADELKNTGKGNLFVIFGEPDIDIETAGEDQIRVQGQRSGRLQTPNRRSASATAPRASPAGSSTPTTTRRASSSATPTSSAQNDPYSALKTTLKAEINEEAWATLHSDISRPFDKPNSGRIAVKVINHLGDEVMKVFPVSPNV